MIKAVIFDIDGTLFDSVDLHAKAWQEDLDLVCAAIEFLLRDKDRHELVAAFADLRTHHCEGHLMAEMG